MVVGPPKPDYHRFVSYFRFFSNVCHFTCIWSRAAIFRIGPLQDHNFNNLACIEASAYSCVVYSERIVQALNVSVSAVLDINVLEGNQPKCFGCPRYNFSCPDIIQMAEIPLDRHVLFFANEESNCIGKKLELTFLCDVKL